MDQIPPKKPSATESGQYSGKETEASTEDRLSRKRLPSGHEQSRDNYVKNRELKSIKLSSARPKTVPSYRKPEPPSVPGRTNNHPYDSDDGYHSARSSPAASENPHDSSSGYCSEERPPEEEMLSNYDSEPKEPIESMIVSYPKHRIMPAPNAKPTRQMILTLEKIQELVSFPSDLKELYQKNLRKACHFAPRLPISTASEFPVERLKKLAYKANWGIVTKGVHEPPFGGDIGWPLFQSPTMDEDRKNYIEKYSPALGLCYSLIYHMEQTPLAIEQKNYLLTKVVSAIIQHTKLAFCGDHAHLGADYLLDAIIHEQLPVRLVMVEFSVHPTKEEAGYHNIIANHIFLVAFPNNPDYKKKNYQGTDNQLIYPEASLIIDPILIRTFQPNRPDLIPIFLGAFGLHDTKNYTFRHTYFY